MSGVQRHSARLAKIMAQLPRAAEAEEVVHDERRFARRKSSRTPGMISAPGGVTNHSCLIKDTSSTGALLEMVKTKMNPDSSSAVVPDRFTLMFQLERVCIDCRVARRRDTEVGIRYVSPARALVPVSRRR